MRPLSLATLLIAGLSIASCKDDKPSPIDASPVAIDGAPSAGLHYFFTCGDPVCRGHVLTGVPACTGETVGQTCTSAGTNCDPADSCDRQITCASSDPTTGAGGCPRSRRSYKDAIHYLDDAELARLSGKLLDFPLATYRYKADGPAGKQRLGFIIDDIEPSPAADAERDMVDLYDYQTMAVAALKTQAKELAALRAQVDRLERQLARTPRRR